MTGGSPGDDHTPVDPGQRVDQIGTSTAEIAKRESGLRGSQEETEIVTRKRGIQEGTEIARRGRSLKGRLRRSERSGFWL